MAEGPTCNAASAEKMLAGAAKTSFLKNCKTDATAPCQAASKENQLSGAAKNSCKRMCINDAAG